MAAQLARLASRKRVTLEEKEQHQWVVDEATLSSVIANGEDVGPIIRPAFEMGKPEALLHQLRTFVKKKEVEIEELCKQHYEEFIHAVDELRYVLVDADELKHGLAMQNTEMQEVGSGLLHKLDELIQHNAIKTNLASALQLLKKCKTVVDLCAKVNEAIAADSYYQALKTLDAIERDHLRTIPSSALHVWVERGIPRCRAHIERKVNQEFNEWLVQIRETSQEIGRQAIGQAFSARQREVELGDRQRQAEEQPSLAVVQRLLLPRGRFLHCGGQNHAHCWGSHQASAGALRSDTRGFMTPALIKYHIWKGKDRRVEMLGECNSMLTALGVIQPA
ncbi:hypothetical protein CLOM_g7865 [Closterium sp. NIES-68]|nr:hypothetical protein CLOM_g7865 [Closterium sp. NIES-68]GJP63662.1 hypothetical protein CLOP_g20726 [Closterium sp. NIES-67]